MNDPVILYQDEHLMVLHKPPGFLVHPSWIAPRSTPNLTDWLTEQFGTPMHTVHRLDRPTSGVIVFARNVECARRMTDLFTIREVEKHYLCIVRGHTEAEGVIDHPLKEDQDKLADRYMSQEREAQEAQTAYRTLGHCELPFSVGKFDSVRYSLVEALPHSGRRHQIRRHMKHISHPILGDVKHGDGRHNKFLRSHFEMDRLLLLAKEIAFVHPMNGERMRISTRPEQDFLALMAQMGWSDVEL